MRVHLTLQMMGYREASGRFARRTEALERERRRLIRNAGRTFLAALRRHAPTRSGRFAQGLFFRTYDRGHHSEARFYAGGEHAFLLPLLVGGTRPHLIPRGGSAAQIAKGYPLRFFWERGPRGPGVYAFWQVHHPGTQPSPFLANAYWDTGPALAADLHGAAVRVAWL